MIGADFSEHGIASDDCPDQNSRTWKRGSKSFGKVRSRKTAKFNEDKYVDNKQSWRHPSENMDNYTDDGVFSRNMRYISFVGSKGNDNFGFYFGHSSATEEADGNDNGIDNGNDNGNDERQECSEAKVDQVLNEPSTISSQKDTTVRFNHRNNNICFDNCMEEETKIGKNVLSISNSLPSATQKRYQRRNENLKRSTSLQED